MRKPLWAGQGQDGLTYPPTPKKCTVSGLESLIVPGIHRASLVAQTVKKSACNAGDVVSIPGWGRSPGGGRGSTGTNRMLSKSAVEAWARPVSLFSGWQCGKPPSALQPHLGGM